MVKTIITEMLDQRGYTEIKQHTYDLSSGTDADTQFDISCVDNTGRLVFIKFLLQRHKLLQSLKKYLSGFDDKDSSIKHIFILKKKQSNSFKKHCESLNVETFKLDELKVNITKHALVPKHTLIRDPIKKEKILKKYNTNKNINSLPEMLITDPICRFYGGKCGDLFEIQRISPVTGKYISYRYVVNLKK